MSATDAGGGAYAATVTGAPGGVTAFAGDTWTTVVYWSAEDAGAA
jgi:hypothetical protein